MKTHGILNAELSSHLAALSHTDQFVIADAGLPVARGVPIVDLRLVFGVPRFTQVLDAVLDEVVVEHVTIASEMATANPSHHGVVSALGTTVDAVPHDEFKRSCAGAKFVVRSAEQTPYSNVLLTAGWIG